MSQDDTQYAEFEQSARPTPDYGVLERLKYRLFRLLDLRSALPFRTPNAVISRRHGISFVTMLKPPTYDEIKVIVRYLALCDIYDRRMWDFSAVDWPFSAEELTDFAIYGDTIMQRNGRLAVLVKDDLGAGMAHLFARHRQAGQKTLAAEFRELPEAIDWLMETDDSLPG